MDDRRAAKDILNLLEDGKIDVEQALQQISEQDQTPAEDFEGPSEVFSPPRRWWAWRAILSSIGFGLTVAGSGVALLGGWWWLLAAPLLFLGIILMLAGLLSFRAPWVYIRVDTGQATWPRRITINLPLPLGPVSWCLKNIGKYAPAGIGRKGMNLVEAGRVLDSMKGSFTRESPLFVEVHDEETGEHVTVHIGW